MANEIFQALTYRVAKDSLTATAEVAGATSDMTGAEIIGQIQIIATSATTVNVGSLASLGALFVQNLDSTNYVEVDDVNTFDDFPQKILPGGWIMLRPQTTTIYAKANTAECRVKIVANEL